MSFLKPRVGDRVKILRTNTGLYDTSYEGGPREFTYLNGTVGIVTKVTLFGRYRVRYTILGEESIRTFHPLALQVVERL
jgi:hypothetical protein